MSTLAAVPPPPREPSERAKKLIYAYAGSQFVRLLVGVVFFIIGTPLSLVFCWNFPGELALTVMGKPAQATVVSTELQTDVEINGQNPTRVVFTYEGRQIESSSMEAGGLSAGSEVDIEYVPWKREWARVHGGSYGTFPVWLGFVLIFPLIGLSLTFSAVRSNRREIRAFRDGQATGGTIVTVGLDTSAEVNGKNPLKVEWSFEAMGKQFNGSLSSMDHGRLSSFKQGDAVTVLYLPDDPTTNTVWVD